MFNQIFSGTYGEKLQKYGAYAMLLLAIFLLVQVFVGIKRFNYIGKEIYPQRTVMVTGEGEAFAIPDVASFSFSVVETGKTVAQAQEKADAKIEKALNTLRESGIEEKDIKNTNYSFYPKYEWQRTPCAAMVSGTVAYPCSDGKNILTGYEVNQTITVKVRETDKAGDLVTKVGAVGASNVSGVEFTVDDREKYVAQAREEAINKAKENAKKLAKNLGVDLGKMIYYNESGNYPGPYYDVAMGMGGMSEKSVSNQARVELPTGENKITSQVSITYEVK